jgi:hypothetical protein
VKHSKRVDERRFRGAKEIQTDPFIFRWTVNSAGYEWLDGEDGKLRLYPVHAPGVGAWNYTPEPGLYREFAALSPTRDAIREFAGKYGDLFDLWPIAYVPARSGRMVGGTSLDRWNAKIEDMRTVVTLWDQIQDERRHAELKKIIVRTDKEIRYVRGRTDVPLTRTGELSRFNPKDVVLPARCALQWEVNKRLSDTDTPTIIVPRLTLTPDFHQRIIFQPSNLLAEMWMRFAQTIAGDFQLKQCANLGCPHYFQVGPGGKRQDTETCSDRCRKEKSRNAK